MASGLCPTCENGFFCPTWTEWRCMKLKATIHGYQKLTSCKLYSKRNKTFKEHGCHCKNCLENEKLLDMEEEE